MVKYSGERVAKESYKDVNTVTSSVHKMVNVISCV